MFHVDPVFLTLVSFRFSLELLLSTHLNVSLWSKLYKGWGGAHNATSALVTHMTPQHSLLRSSPGLGEQGHSMSKSPQQPASFYSPIILRTSLLDLCIVHGYKLLAMGKWDLQKRKEKQDYRNNYQTEFHVNRI